MAKTVLNVKTDAAVKKAAQKLSKRLDIPLSLVVTAALRRFVEERRLVIEEACPFPSHTPNAETRKAIREARNRKNVETFKSVDQWEKEMRQRLALS